ncbi:MAG: 4Fe-4S dicluster domain-containing protein [Caldisericia bacterium]|nr:4Fe-4S dicluster domain-containing protein [Caldisericia bacterium]
MADIFWKTWDLDCFDVGSQSFFNELNLPENQYFRQILKEPKNSQIILLSCLPKDRKIFSKWLQGNGKIWLDFFSSLSKNTVFFSSQHLPEDIVYLPLVFRNLQTEYVKDEPETIVEPLFSTNPSPPKIKLKSTYLPTILYDAERIIPITCTQHSYQFGLFCALSSLYYLLPTMTQTEIQLYPTKALRSEALIQAVKPLLKKIPISMNINLEPKPFILLSNDVVSADAYSAMFNGVRVSSIPFLGAASKSKLGISDVLMIHNRSDRFYKAINQKQQKWGRWSLIRINQESCTLCADCITACPFQALTLFEQDKIDWNSSLCNRCGYCLDICPEKAIKS